MDFKHNWQWQACIAWLALIVIFIHISMLIWHLPHAHSILLIPIIMGGVPLFVQIVSKILRGNLGADLLAIIALITGVILHENLAATLIILMLTGGQTLENYAMRKASSVLLALAMRMPSVAHRKINGHIEDIALHDIRIDDEISIYPHETCPVDGVVISGHGSMNEAYLTGEPYQVSKAPGTNVLSGAINGASLLNIKAIKLASDSRYAVIIKVLEDAEQKRPTLRRLGDQIGAIFAPLALIFAVIVWCYTGDMLRFLAILVIATPCPLLIAIPITLISAISKAAKQSIIIRDPMVLERLSTCKTAIFDKTGTLTYGKPRLTEILTTPDYNSKVVLQYAASLERYSKHPLAMAILNAAEERNIMLLEASKVSEKPGEGLLGIINALPIHVMSRQQLLDIEPQCFLSLPPIVPGLECMILINHQYAATLCFNDIPRAESKSFISHLVPFHQFKKIMLVSGDKYSAVRYLGKLLTLTEIHASQTPEQKLAIVRQEVQRAPTVFMGDGINDAPALTAATVGIAFGQYNEITAAASGVVIMDSALSKVDELIHLSLHTRAIALQSAIGGMIFSILGMGVAAYGVITPVTGAILQEIIDVLAILNALRLTWNNKIKIDLPGSSAV